MTEERYSLDHTVVPQPLIREHGVCMEIGVVVDKLNMLSEERNQFQFQYNMEVLKRQSLEKENEQLKNSVDILDKVRNELIDENEKLKSELEESKKAHSNCDKLWWELHDEKEQLEKENEQLKQFKKQVLQLIDEKIKECDTRECDCCRNCIGDQLLGELKKELKE